MHAAPVRPGPGYITATVGGSQPGEMEIRSGVIEQIKFVQIQSNHHRGIGAVVGGLAGLGIGSLIGDGTGRDVAMVFGAVGGAVAGNEVQKKYVAPKPGQQKIVRTNNSVLVSVIQPKASGEGFMQDDDNKSRSMFDLAQRKKRELGDTE